jgi:hypothetical protein
MRLKVLVAASQGMRLKVLVAASQGMRLKVPYTRTRIRLLAAAS